METNDKEQESEKRYSDYLKSFDYQEFDINNDGKIDIIKE